MFFTFIVKMMLLGSSVVIAFVLQPSKDVPATNPNSPVSHQRCQGESLQSIRKGLLRTLNLQTEPQLPAGSLDSVRKEWKRTFGNIAHRAKDAAATEVSPPDGNSTSLKCCTMASEIFMKDLGWDNWVLHPASLTIIQCAACNSEVNTVLCPSAHTNVQDADSQVPCCQPTSHTMVPVVYMDEFRTLTISSMQLIHTCGCAHDSFQQASEE